MHSLLREREKNDTLPHSASLVSVVFLPFLLSLSFFLFLGGERQEPVRRERLQERERELCFYLHEEEKREVCCRIKKKKRGAADRLRIDFGNGISADTGHVRFGRMKRQFMNGFIVFLLMSSDLLQAILVLQVPQAYRPIMTTGEKRRLLRIDGQGRDTLQVRHHTMNHST